MREYKIKDIKNMKDKKTLQNQITSKHNSKHIIIQQFVHEFPSTTFNNITQ